MPSNRWSTENKLVRIFGGVLSHNVVSEFCFVFHFYLLKLFVYFYFHTLQILYIYSMACSLYGIPEDEQMGLCVCSCSSYHFLTYLIPFCLFVLPHSEVFIFVISYYILFYCYPLEGCLFLMDKGVVQMGGERGETRRKRGKGNHNQNTWCEKKNLFSINGKTWYV